MLLRCSCGTEWVISPIPGSANGLRAHLAVWTWHRVWEIHEGRH